MKLKYKKNGRDLDMRQKRMFVVSIEILSDMWSGIYKKGQTQDIPIVANSYFNAQEKFGNIHCGSEYPEYKITRIQDMFEVGYLGYHIKEQINLQ